MHANDMNLADAKQCGLSCADSMLCVKLMPTSPHCDLWERNAYQWALRAAHHARRCGMGI